MRNLILIVLFLLLNASMCYMDKDRVADFDVFITVENQTNRDILRAYTGINDTLLERFRFLKDETQMQLATVPAHGNSKIWTESDAIKNGWVSVIFLFDKQTVIDNPWDSIVANNLVLARYDLDYEELQALNWHVVYP